MEREHCHSTDSSQLFHTSNYGLDTRSDIEFYFVVDPDAGRKLAKREGMATSGGSEDRWWPRNRLATSPSSNRTPIEGAPASPQHGTTAPLPQPRATVRTCR